METQKLLQLVNSALFPESTQNQRAQAEAQIIQLSHTNPSLFFYSAAEGFGNNQIPLQIRIACSTLFKRFASYIAQGQNDVLWMCLAKPLREQIKLIFMNQLIDPSKEVRQSSANTISEIAAIEIPRNEWPTLITSLMSQTKNEDVTVRQSAVITLGYICEAMKQRTSGISDQDHYTILMGICQGMDEKEQNLEIKFAAIKAVKDSLYFMHKTYEHDFQVRNYVRNLLMANTVSQNSNIKLACYQCLIEFVNIQFLTIPEYITPLFNCTKISFEGEEPVVIAAIEVWNAICNEMKEILENQQLNQSQETQQVLNIIKNFLMQNAQEFIIPFMKNLLINKEDDDDDYMGEGVQQSSYKCLGYIVEFVGAPAISTVTTFITNTIQHAQWQYRKAGVMAFGALAEGGNQQEVREILPKPILTLLDALQDANYQVKKAAAFSLQKIAENYPECILENSEASGIMQKLLAALQNKVGVARHAVGCISYLTDNLQKYPNSVVNQDKQRILSYLASTSVRADLASNDYNIVDSAFIGILSIIYTYNDEKMYKELLNQFINQLGQIDNFNPDHKRHLQAGLLSAMHGCLVKLPPEELSDAECDKIMQIVMSQSPQVQADSFYTIAGLATCLKKRISRWSQVILSHLNAPLQEPNDPETFKSALYCLADVARSIEEEFTAYLKILNYFIDKIEDPNFSRDLKIQLFNTISDILIGVKENCIEYVPRIKDVMRKGFEACICLSQSHDFTELDLAERMKDAMIAFYTCFLHSFCDNNRTHPLVDDTIEQLFYFCEQTADKKLKPTLDYARSVVNAVFDVANFFNNHNQIRPMVQKFITGPFIQELLRSLNKFGNDKDAADAVKYACEILRENYKFNEFEIQNFR